jgi:hypothetical protein
MAAYFTRNTDRSIENFQDADESGNKVLAHEIFDKEIRPAFEKLIENLIYVYGFYTLGDVQTLQRECLTDLYSTLPKFDASKSANPNKLTSAAFSYFNMVAKNWFIARARENQKKNKNESELFYDLDHEAAKNDPNFQVSAHETIIEEKERWLEFYKAMDIWRDKLKKKNEKQVLEAIIFIMKNAEMISIYNKKAVYLYLRELTGLNTKQIVVNLKKIKALYAEWHETYHSTGATIDAEDDYEDDEGEFDGGDYSEREA